MRIYDERGDRAVVWENYKAGVVDTRSGEIIVPIRFDEVHWRIQTFRSPGPGIRPLPPEYAGFACFTEDGEAVAYDYNGNVDDWKDWESGFLNLTPSPRPERTLEEVEKEIFERYHANIQRQELEDLLYERKRILDYDWKHSPENTVLISELNERLNKAVREALRLGEAAEQLVKDSGTDWSVDVEVYPEWEEPDSEDPQAPPFSIQNIIAELGRAIGYKDASPCFQWGRYNESANSWDFKEATLDDGRSWDEGPFRHPAYMDCYFVHPFQQLCYDNYILALSDLLSIKDFYINVLINKPTKQ